MRCWPGTASCTATAICSARAGASSCPRSSCAPRPRRRLVSLLALIRDFDREIQAGTTEIDALAKHDARVDVLCQIRGIGPYTAILVIAEVGDISRFGSARKLCA